MTAGANKLALDDDINTTAPQSKPTEWKMPEPVFRRTSGRLPGDFEKQVALSMPSEHETVERSSDAVEAYIEPKPENPTLKVLVVALALVAMVAFIAAFLTILYFYFLRSSD
ncbi:MAG TPA: hypothetical protein VJV05_01980 [Pyrinomonadaceae bacterium]|nr:hypothetical protein [Pyrinomonadaceae bacterium]